MLHLPTRWKANDKPFRRRPYWHVDMKWICSLALLVVLGWWLLALAAYRITEAKTGITLTTNVLAYNFSRNGLDDTSGIAELKAQAQASPSQNVQPIEDIPATLSLHDLSTLSPRDLRLKLFGQIAESVYYKGVDGYAQQITSDPAKQQKFKNEAAFLDAVTQKGHQSFGALTVWLGIAVLLLLAGVLYFSAGFGRLVTPAIVLLLASAPGVAASSGLRAWTEEVPSVSAAQSEDIGALLDATKGAFTQAVTSAQKTYLVAFIIAVALLVTAAAGKITTKLIRHRSADANLTSD